MNPKFYPVFHLFLERVLYNVDQTTSEATLTLVRRYNMTPEQAAALLLEASATRWFVFKIAKGSIRWRSAGLRKSASVEKYRLALEIMSDGVWRSADTLATIGHLNYLAAQDICDVYEAIGLFDSKLVWKDETVYCKIHGAVPALYAPTFSVF